MFTKIRKTLAVAAATFGLVAITLVALPTTTFAQATGGSGTAGSNDLNLSSKLKCGTNLDVNDPDTCSADTGNTEANFNSILRKVINLFSIIVGVLSLIMIIWSAVLLGKSGGDPPKVAAGRNTIMYALIALVVVALAQFIVQFVLDKVSSFTSGS